MIHACSQHGRSWCLRCVLITISFPIEHLIWERTPLRFIMPLLGLH